MYHRLLTSQSLHIFQTTAVLFAPAAMRTLPRYKNFIYEMGFSGEATRKKRAKKGRGSTPPLRLPALCIIGKLANKCCF